MMNTCKTCGKESEYLDGGQCADCIIEEAVGLPPYEYEQWLEEMAAALPERECEAPY